MGNYKKYTVNGLILAAGLSRRMGEFKPLMNFGKKTLIECTVDSMLSAGVSQVVVVLGYRGKEVEEVLKSQYGNQVILVYNNKYEFTDMLFSIKCGLTVMPNCHSYFLLPGDMPLVKKTTFKVLLDAIPSNYPAILFPSLFGYSKHPPLINSYFTQSILDFNEEGGLRQLWNKLEDFTIRVPVEDEGVGIDFDTKQVYIDYINSSAFLGR
ncbi:MAG: nucleotidyltransferase family protein [Clostridiales bacterium]|nr:nucleotidyltransferase family protein [Clostridiales bacterium]